MKKTVNIELLQGMEELPMEELTSVTGGESIWYWVGYAIGSAIYHINGNQTGGQRLMNAALS